MSPERQQNDSSNTQACAESSRLSSSVKLNADGCFSKMSDQEINRDPEDFVYQYTTEVVYAVRQLLQGVQECRYDEFVSLVKHVGSKLRDLLASVDRLVPQLPLWSHREVELTHKVLSKDMALLIEAMKAALNYSQTTVEREYRKGMLKAAHVLVVDAKNLLDSVDSVRQKLTSDMTL